MTKKANSNLLNKNMTALAGGLGLALSSTAQSAIIYEDVMPDAFSDTSIDGLFSFTADLDNDGVVGQTCDLA